MEEDWGPASSVPPGHRVTAPARAHWPLGTQAAPDQASRAYFGETVGLIGPSRGFLQGCSYLFSLNKTGQLVAQ